MQQFIGVLRSQCGVAQLSPILVFSFGYGAPRHVFAFLIGCRGAQFDTVISAATEQLLDLGITVRLFGLTARMAAMIEPTTQRARSKIRPLKQRPIINSIALASMTHVLPLPVALVPTHRLAAEVPK
jgi:hypothetical protein